MQANRGRDTTPELRLRSALHGHGLRFYKNRRINGVRAEIDVVFPRIRLAVFVDGCYWHGCPDHGTFPVRNAVWWRGKLEGNHIRDRATDERLAAAGWTVMRIWEHDDVESAAARVESLVLRLRQTTS